MCTKFPHFLQTPNYVFFFFVVVRCEQNPTHIHTFVVSGVTCLSQDVKKSSQRLIMAPNNARCLYLILNTFHLTVFRLLTCCLSSLYFEEIYEKVNCSTSDDWNEGHPFKDRNNISLFVSYAKKRRCGFRVGRITFGDSLAWVSFLVGVTGVLLSLVQDWNST